MQIAREKVLHYGQNCAAEFGWSRKKAINHILQTHPHLKRQAIAEDQRREFENPEEVIMNAVQKEHEKDPSQSRVAVFSKFFKANPQTARAYDRKVLRKSRSVTEASSAIDRRARAYMAESGEQDYLKAVRHVLARHKNYQDEQDSEGIEIRSEGPEADVEDMRGGVSPYQGLGSLVAKFISRGDLAGAVRVQNQYPELSQQAGQEWLLREGKKWADNMAVPGLNSQNETLGRSQVLNQHPEMRPMIARGVGTEATLRTIYPQFFKS